MLCLSSEHPCVRACVRVVRSTLLCTVLYMQGVILAVLVLGLVALAVLLVVRCRKQQPQQPKSRAASPPPANPADPHARTREYYAQQPRVQQTQSIGPGQPQPQPPQVAQKPHFVKNPDPQNQYKQQGQSNDNYTSIPDALSGLRDQSAPQSSYPSGNPSGYPSGYPSAQHEYSVNVDGGTIGGNLRFEKNPQAPLAPPNQYKAQVHSGAPPTSATIQSSGRSSSSAGPRVEHEYSLGTLQGTTGASYGGTGGATTEGEQDDFEPSNDPTCDKVFSVDPYGHNNLAASASASASANASK